MKSAKELIFGGADALIVCTAKDLQDAFLSIFDKLQEREPQKQMSDEGDGLVAADELCRMLSVTKATLWRWAKHDFLVPVKVGRKNFYHKSDLDALTKKKGVRDEI